MRAFGLKGLLILLVLALSGCATPGMYLDTSNAVQLPQPPHAQVSIRMTTIAAAAHSAKHLFYKPTAYRVGPEDVLSIIVWDHPELTIPAGEYRSASQSGNVVSIKGDIFYPYVGRVRVAGLTTEQIRRLLTKRLARYIQKPQVSVRVAKFASQNVQVIGAVKQPLTEPVTNQPLSLIDAINAAGGFDPLMSNPRVVYVIRGPASHPTLFRLNADHPSSLILAENFYLKNQDVVYVAKAGMASWQQVLSSIMPVVQSAWYIKELSR